jgi:dolichol-phosphate mannosyltransferase
VLGSRYVEGGGVRNWGLLDAWIISGRGLLVRAVLLGAPVSTTWTGASSATAAPCSRRSTSKRSTRRATPFQIERRTARCAPASASVEVPITFADREAGGSKMSKSIVAEAIWKIPRLSAATQAGRL